MTRIFFFLLGFGLMTIGFVYLIMYLNMEYNFSDYVNFIIKRPECYLVLFGLLVLNMALYVKGEKHGIRL